MDASSTADIERPVQKQLDAYNARDIDAFMPWWSEDCHYYEFPDRLLARGASVSVREQTESFESVSGLPLKSQNLL